MTTSKLVKYGCLILALAGLSQIGLHLIALPATHRTDNLDLTQKTLITRAEMAGEASMLDFAGVEKSVTPEGQVTHGDELTYTLVISTAPGMQVRLYDPLMDMTFMRFVEQPSGVTYAGITSGTLQIGVITGTLMFTPTNQVTVSFVAQVNVPATQGWTVTVTNRACVYPFGGFIRDCVWSNEVSNVTLPPPLTTYLPLILKAPRCHSCYYVDSVNGSDANPGTSADEPWQTLAPVHAMDFVPGSVVHFRRGSSWTGGLVIDDSGTKSKPIIFTTYGVGNRPVFANPGTSTRVVVINADWVVVEGLLVQDAHKGGVEISSGSDNNIVRDIEATNVGSGIVIRGRHNLVTGNYVHDLHMIVNTPGGNDDYGATGIGLSNSGNEVSFNTMANCIAPSYDWGEDGGGVEVYGDADGNYIHHNWVVESDGFLEVGGGSARDTVVAYNVSVNNERFSWIHLSGDFASEVENFRVEHNTIVEAADDEGWVAFGFRGDPTESAFVVRNNILYLDGFGAVSNRSSFTHDHNLYYLGGGTQLGFTPGQGEQVADPLFLNLAEQDFYLHPESPAINAGINLGYTLDFENRPVPVGATPDLGAFEYQGTPENELIIDDTDPGFSTSSFQDAWQEYIEVGGQHYVGTHYYNRQIGTGEDVATWSFTVPQPGRYQVYVWWWEGSWRPTDVPYTINRLDGSVVISSTTVRVNQQVNGGQWNFLDTFDFQSQGSVTVSDNVSSGRDVVADAIRLVYLEPSTSTSVSQSAAAPTPTAVPPTVTPTPICTPTGTPTATNTPTPAVNPIPAGGTSMGEQDKARGCLSIFAAIGLAMQSFPLWTRLPRYKKRRASTQ